MRFAINTQTEFEKNITFTQNAKGNNNSNKETAEKKHTRRRATDEEERMNKR